MWGLCTKIRLFPYLLLHLQISTSFALSNTDHSISKEHNRQRINHSNRFQGSMTSKLSNMTHYARRIQHALTGILFYLLSFVISTKLASSLLVIATLAFYILLHLGRAKSKRIQDMYLQWFGSLLREHEKQLHQLPGAFWFLLGTTIVVLCFDMQVARISILCLSLGDPIAALVGIRFGGYYQNGLIPPNKSIHGCVSCFIVCFCICITHISIDCFRNAIGISIVTALVATIMECYGKHCMSLDDNLLISLGVATTLHMFDYDSI